MVWVAERVRVVVGRRADAVASRSAGVVGVGVGGSDAATVKRNGRSGTSRTTRTPTTAPTLTLSRMREAEGGAKRAEDADAAAHGEKHSVGCSGGAEWAGEPTTIKRPTDGTRRERVRVGVGTGVVAVIGALAEAEVGAAALSASTRDAIFLLRAT